MNYNNLCICFQPAIKIDAFCFQFLILDWRNCWQGCWTEKDFLADELSYLSDLEAEMQQQQQQQQTSIPSRNGQVQSSGKSKGSQQSPHIGHSQKSTSIRSNSTDRNKSSARALSLDRNGRATPPNPSLVLSEPSVTSSNRARGHGERDSSTERAISSSDSRDGLHPRATAKRPPPSVSTEIAIDLDDGATPTQAQHSRGPSESTQFRLDLRDPPSSPFNIKF